MIEMTLKEYCKEYSQTRAAKLMGRSSAAICQMLANGREVTVVTDDVGHVRFFERKELKARQPKEPELAGELPAQQQVSAYTM
jgi:hypothetical protein